MTMVGYKKINVVRITNSYYGISDCGKVISYKGNGKVLNNRTDKGCVELWIDGVRRRYSVKQLLIKYHGTK